MAEASNLTLLRAYREALAEPAAINTCHGTSEASRAYETAILARMVKPSSYARCSMCGAPLDVPGRPWSANCGGDCIACMAECDDPECEEAVAAMRAGEAASDAMTELRRLSRRATLGQATPRPWMTGNGNMVSEVVIGDHSLSDMHEHADAEFLAACWNYVRRLIALRDALPPEKGNQE